MIYTTLSLAILVTAILVTKIEGHYTADPYGRKARFVELGSGYVIELEEFSRIDGVIQVELTNKGFLAKGDAASCTLIRPKHIGGTPELPAVLESGDLLYTNGHVYQFCTEVKNDEN